VHVIVHLSCRGRRRLFDHTIAGHEQVTEDCLVFSRYVRGPCLEQIVAQLCTARRRCISGSGQRSTDGRGTGTFQRCLDFPKVCGIMPPRLGILLILAIPRMHILRFLTLLEATCKITLLGSPQSGYSKYPLRDPMTHVGSICPWRCPRSCLLAVRPDQI
jgi:hypothetical protein